MSYQSIKEETWLITLSTDHQSYDREFTLSDSTHRGEVNLKSTLNTPLNQNIILDISLAPKENLAACKIRVQDIIFQVQRPVVGAARRLVHYQQNRNILHNYYDQRAISPSNSMPVVAESDICVGNLVIDTQRPSSVLLQYARPGDSFTLKFTVLYTLEWKYEPKTLSQSYNLHFQSYGFGALEDFQAMMCDETTADIQIKATLGNEEIFSCHKFVLIARSQIFRAMLDSPMTERDQKEITVKDIGPATMEHFLSFLYCGKFQNDTWVQYLPNLTYVADKYCVSGLKDFCDKNLIKSVTCTNALAIANLAQRHELPTAVGEIRKFVEKNAASLNFDIAAAAEGLEIGE